VDVFNALKYGRRQKEKWRARYCGIKKFRKDIIKKCEKKVNNSGRGIVQGSPISAMLSNVYMIDFDNEIYKFCEERGVFYRRYSDDILIVSEIGKYEAVLEFVCRKLNEHKLSLSKKKCRADLVRNGVFLRNPVQYLGFIYDGNNVYIRPSSLAKYWRRAKFSIRSHKIRSWHQGRLGQYSSVFLRKIYEKHSHLGENNFYAYAKSASEVFSEPKIKKQLRRHMSKIKKFVMERR
jgi:hypothetical protein